MLISDPIEKVIAAFKAGAMVIIADDEDRENEGDLVVATSALKEEHLVFMMREARGLICASISAEDAERLDLPFQVLNNNSSFHTPFTLSVDRKYSDEPGITAHARSLTIRGLIDPNMKADDFVVPGCVFPLIAHPSGVFARRGQTEASHDLARISGFAASGVICEILNEDGTMARGAELRAFADRHGILVTTVAEIARYRVQHDTLARKGATRTVETSIGQGMLTEYFDEAEDKIHLVLRFGDVARLIDGSPPLVRIHSECLTGDVFGSRRCDCGPQLKQSLDKIRDEGAGIVVYLRQEGRGIGLANKVRAYELQDEGADTVQANERLGFEPDRRNFAVAASILISLNVQTVRLMTNNPDKTNTLSRFGVHVSERVPLVVPADVYMERYLETKRTKLGHLI